MGTPSTRNATRASNKTYGCSTVGCRNAACVHWFQRRNLTISRRVPPLTLPNAHYGYSATSNASLPSPVAGRGSLLPLMFALLVSMLPCLNAVGNGGPSPGILTSHSPSACATAAVWRHRTLIDPGHSPASSSCLCLVTHPPSPITHQFTHHLSPIFHHSSLSGLNDSDLLNNALDDPAASLAAENHLLRQQIVELVHSTRTCEVMPASTSTPTSTSMPCFASQCKMAACTIG